MSSTNHQYQMEYLTGLLSALGEQRQEQFLSSLPNNHVDSLTEEVIEINPSCLDALRCLRDSNPALLKKLSNKDKSIDDDSLSKYWSLSSNGHPIGVFSPCGRLRHLNLGGSMVRLVTMESFLEKLESSSSCDNEVDAVVLETLDLGGTDLPAQALFVAFERAPNVCASLRHLYLSGNAIAGQQHGIEYLSRALDYCTNLKTFDLRYNDLLGEQHAIPLLETLFLKNRVAGGSSSSSSSKSTVEVLHLEGNQLRCDGAKALGDILSSSSSLKELYLGANGIQSHGAIELAFGLQKNASLQKLYLEGNQIGKAGADAFSQVLEDQTQRSAKVLQKLYADNNGIGKESSKRLALALNSDTVITESLLEA